jgi:hypothetical protein
MTGFFFIEFPLAFQHNYATGLLKQPTIRSFTLLLFPYNIFAYYSICRVDCKFARNKKKTLLLRSTSI